MQFEAFVAGRYLLGDRSGRLVLSLVGITLLLSLFGLVLPFVALLALLIMLWMGHRLNLITVISFIAIFSITIGTAALITVLSVFNGFNGIVKDLFIGFDPHLRITPVDALTLEPESILGTIRDDPDVIAAAPFVSGRSALLHEDGMKVIQIRGMRKEDIGTAVGLGDRIVSGSFMEHSEHLAHPIVLGSTLSYSLRAFVGDTISILSQAGLEESLTQLASPTILQCIVTGEFESRNREYDSYYAYTDIATARALFDQPEGAMGIEIRLDNVEKSEQVRSRLQERLGTDYRIETWQDLHSDLYATMELERWVAFLILSLIVIVAVSSILGSLTMTVMQKRRDIGILKAMGMTDRAIRRIFLLEGAYIGIIGTASGLLHGLLICFLQQEFGFFQLDSNVYIISALPVEINWPDVVVIGLTSFLLALGASLYPARRAARLLPADAVRWE